MDINTWIQKIHKDIEVFQTWWLCNNFETPDHFPMDLEESDWEEMFEFWKDNHEGT